jgi:ABC-type Mn2+/Zn2+ transport system permease subunit
LSDDRSVLTRIILIDTFSSIAVMSISSPSSAPWQLSQGSAASRITAAALIAVALDSAFAWRVVPVVVSIALLIIPLLVAIRVIRGFPSALLAAAATLGAVAVLAGVSFTSLVLGQPTNLAALSVAAIVSVVGLAAAIAGSLNERRRGHVVISIELTEPDGFAVARSPHRRSQNRTYR